MALSEKAKSFVLNFIGEANLCGTTAVVIAHGLNNRRSAAVQAAQYMKDPEILAAIREAMAKRATKLEYDALQVLADLITIKTEAMKDQDRDIAIKALALIGKHFGMFTEKIKVEGFEPLIIELPMAGKSITLTTKEGNDQ